MKIQTVGRRSILFVFEYPEWNLNLHLILGDKYDYLIDTGMGRDNIKHVFDYLAQKKRDKELIVVNTHYHFDHIWGNYLFKDNIIIAHELCPEMIDGDWDKSRLKYDSFLTAEVVKTYPNLLIRDELYFVEDGIRIFASPGHSADGISVLDEADGVLNVGDNIGDTMDAIVPELECEVKEYGDVLERYLALDFTHVISGHNEVCGKDILSQILSLLP